MTKVTLKEVLKIFPDQISEATASRYINYARDVLNKPKPQIITLTEFKKVYGLNNN